jgi:amidase
VSFVHNDLKPDNCQFRPEDPDHVGAIFDWDITTVGEPLSPMATFTGAWNATGQPAISLPFAMSSTGLPIGIQLVAAYGREDLLLRVGAAMEADIRWDLRCPPVHVSQC